MARKPAIVRSIKEDYDKAVTEKQKEKLKVQMLTQAKELLMMKGLKIPKKRHSLVVTERRQYLFMLRSVRSATRRRAVDFRRCCHWAGIKARE